MTFWGSCESIAALCQGIQIVRRRKWGLFLWNHAAVVRVGAAAELCQRTQIVQKNFFEITISLIYYASRLECFSNSESRRVHGKAVCEEVFDKDGRSKAACWHGETCVVWGSFSFWETTSPSLPSDYFGPDVVVPPKFVRIQWYTIDSILSYI